MTPTTYLDKNFVFLSSITCNKRRAYPSFLFSDEWMEVINLVCFGSVLGRVAREVLQSRERLLSADGSHASEVGSVRNNCIGEGGMR